MPVLSPLWSEMCKVFITVLCFSPSRIHTLYCTFFNHLWSILASFRVLLNNFWWSIIEWCRRCMYYSMWFASGWNQSNSWQHTLCEQKSSPSCSGVATPKPFAGFHETVLAQELRLAEERQAVQLQELQVFQLRKGGRRRWDFILSFDVKWDHSISTSFKVNSFFFPGDSKLHHFERLVWTSNKHGKKIRFLKPQKSPRPQVSCLKKTKFPRHLMFQMMIWRQAHVWSGQVSPKQKCEGGVKCENMAPKIVWFSMNERSHHCCGHLRV